MDFIRSEMARRAPGTSPMSTARREADEPHILSGVFEGKTTGTPLCAVIENTDTRSRDYAKLKDLPRPGHADYAGHVRYEGCNDYRGGGHFSGRLTAPLVFAGALAKLILKERGVTVSAVISNVGGVADPTPEQMEKIVLAAKGDLDSVGGAIRCTVDGLPAGLGAPDYGRNVEGIFSQQLYAVPAVKAVAFGSGFGFAAMRGSQANDPFYMTGLLSAPAPTTPAALTAASPTACRWSLRWPSGPPPPSPGSRTQWTCPPAGTPSWSLKAGTTPASSTGPCPSLRPLPPWRPASSWASRGRGGPPAVRGRASGAYKRFAPGKTLAQAEFTSAEQVNITGLPRRACGAGMPPFWRPASCRAGI